MDKDKLPTNPPLKVRVLNALPFVVQSLIVYFIIGTAWPSLVDNRDTGEVTRFLITVGITFGLWFLLALGGLAGIIRINLGDRLFVKYYPNFDVSHLKPAKKQKSPGKSTKSKSTRAIKALKSKFTTILVQQGRLRKTYVFISLGLNTGNFMLIVLLRAISYKAGSPISIIAGMLYWGGVIYNLLTIWILLFAQNLQPRKNRVVRILIRVLSWGYLVALPVSSVSFLAAWLRQYNLLDGLAMSIVPKLFFLRDFSYISGLIFFIIIGIVFLKNPPEFLPKDVAEAPEKKKSVIGVFIGYVFIVLLAISFLLSHEHLLVDAIMILCSSSYLLISVGLFFYFAAKKIFSMQSLSQKTARGVKKAILVLGLFSILFNALPTIATRTYTNPSLDRQFTEVYGTGWEELIPADSLMLMRNSPYSRFDAYFGYDIPINAEYDRIYMTDSPRYVKNGTTEEVLSNGTGKYLNITHEMMFDAYLPAGEGFEVGFGDGQTAKKYPIIIFLHGMGMERGYGNINWTSQYYANLGYAVFDMSYGFMGMFSAPDSGQRNKGYDFPDTIQQIGYFTRYLANRSDYYHADLSNTYIAGRSFGGWMSVSIGWLYNTPFLGTNFSSSMNVRGILPYYPYTDGASREAAEYFSGDIGSAPFIRGSPDPEAPDFNAEWQWYNPLWQAEQSAPGTLAPIMVIQGTHDFDVPWKSAQRLTAVCQTNGHTIIRAYYPFGGHGCDALHWSHYGQSITYYAERFLALCRI